ncbi:MAG: hydrogenase iron-sulfur subunit, partial [Gammaproteobacteria bacterium]|nr:hydrogenase iron-sulfur subunit [Gammaproteobacteria bacterium]
ALLCSGMVPPTFIDYALKKGADGVFITTCRTDDCFFRFGNTWLGKRISGDRKPVLRSRVDQRRVNLFGGAETDSAQFRQALDSFRQSLAKLDSETETIAAAGTQREVIHGQ